MLSTETFWNQIYEANPTRTPQEDDPVLLAALNHFGNVQGLRVLDLGCGNGSSSLFFAKRGANVVSIDISEIAIQSLSQFCLENQISNITPIKTSAFDIAKLGSFDFIFGNLILHHLEPFNCFVEVLKESLAPGGKAFFHENNAMSDLLIWFRNNIVGKYGIPKYGDDDEFPLTPKEVEILKRNFDVNIIYPQLAFFGLAAVYLFKGHLHGLMQGIDNYLFQFPSLRKYSYLQYLLLTDKLANSL